VCFAARASSPMYRISTSLAVNEKEEDKHQIGVEIERGNFVRAALLGASSRLPEQELRDLQFKALWQMSAEYRNAPGTRRLAQQYGLSKQEVRESLEKCAEDKRNRGNGKPLEPCCDIDTGEYLSFEKWMERLLKNWDKLSVS
jgi:hypothetical protein